MKIYVHANTKAYLYTPALWYAVIEFYKPKHDDLPLFYAVRMAALKEILIKVTPCLS